MRGEACFEHVHHQLMQDLGGAWTSGQCCIGHLIGPWCCVTNLAESSPEVLQSRDPEVRAVEAGEVLFEALLDRVGAHDLGREDG
eukprot:6282384-Pyramimonas_sp.AAC.1